MVHLLIRRSSRSTQEIVFGSLFAGYNPSLVRQEVREGREVFNNPPNKTFDFFFFFFFFHSTPFHFLLFLLLQNAQHDISKKAGCAIKSNRQDQLSEQAN
eukprot:TRINITY_DN6437_c0_g1_i1.p1 TRINITY_DN6437_c0_g1~~TRINITY_DN6437_c0_g1_i1.p1  ORF type:complete len:100 (-),score=3.56 TRINITY_DN6437_c0_g1_i1:116-415(-)